MNFRHYIRCFSCNGNIFLYGSPECLHALISVSKAKIYHEITEHHDVVLSFYIHAGKRKYIEACEKLSGLFVISSSLKQSFVSLEVSENRFHIINMIVDSDRFELLRKNDDKDCYITYCGTITNSKDGVDILIKAFSIFSKSHQNVKLYVIGEYPKRSQEQGNYKLLCDLELKDKVFLPEPQIK